MKVSLVVASGVHQGKQIPILGAQFLIGRDPECQLRPASQAVSKQHCAVLVRDGKVYVKDYGSTNGTQLNDVLLKGEERPVANNDTLKIGPLDFTVRIEAVAPPPDGTPLPDINPEAAAALAAVKAAAGAPARPAKNATPAPRPAPAKPGSKESLALKPGSKELPALATPPAPNPNSDTVVGEDDNDKIAAMIFGLDDDGASDVPGGSTVAELPTVGAGDATVTGDSKAGEKKDDAKKQQPSREDTSNAASEILRKYMRRPK